MWVEIGGTVYDATIAPPAAVPAAWVAIADIQGSQLATTTTDAQGRFIFNQLRPGDYALHFAATNYPAPPAKKITIPSPTGEYNLQFT
jgi:5-hydroxyisourate hydrolase-like protein (transthyretin family)